MAKFGDRLLQWHSTIDRQMPWKETTDPYKIWISEVILQQTRVAQGWDYYQAFISRFPDVNTLALAPLDAVMKQWEGLGYYTRARNLHHAAQYIVNHHNGVFPNSYDEIIKLKGVGPYTAAAISSFAFGQPYPVLDGNVQRVLSRYYGVANPIDVPSTQSELRQLLSVIFSGYNPSAFNQAIMDLGAIICSPKKYLCQECPLSDDCIALRNGTIQILPIKSKTVKISTRHFQYLIIKTQNGYIIRQRQPGDIWESLYDFPVIYSPQSPTHTQIIEHLEEQGIEIGNYELLESRSLPVHKLTHQILHISVHYLRVSTYPLKIKMPYLLVEKDNLQKFAFPKALHDIVIDL